MLAAPLVPGAVIIAHAATKPRPCVVIKVIAASGPGQVSPQDDTVIVAPCRGQAPPDGRCVVVRVGSAAYRALGLSKQTHFHPNVERIRRAAIIQLTSRSCPLAVLLEIRRLVGFDR